MSRMLDLQSAHRIEYLDLGQGKPIVYFHGGGGVFRTAAFFSELARSYHVLAPSRPGYDASTGAVASAREDAEVMAAFMRNATDSPVHLIAESAGGAVGCWLAVLYPELVESLILVAPAAFAGASHAPPPASPETLERRLFGEHPAWTEPPSEAARAARQRNASANAARMRSPDGNADLLEQLGNIAAPTLILWGTADEVVPPESSQVYIQRIPQSYRIFIYGAAHVLPVSACRQFVALAEDFIERGERFVVNQAS